MTDELFSRTCSLIVNNLQVDGLRVVFKVEKSLGKEPNTAEIAVANLSKTSRGGMQSKGSNVVLLAGYEGNGAVIFSGVSRTITHTLEGSDWVTKITCGDGETSFTFDRISESFAPGTRVSVVARAIVRAMLVDPGNAFSQVDKLEGKFLQGYTLHGRAAVELDRILRPRGYSFSIQDGRLQILKPSETAVGRAILLTPDTGMIGSPELGAPEKTGGGSRLKVKSFLQPSFRPGGTVEVRSRLHTGQFRIEKVSHSGDTSGGDWYSSLEVKPT